jgi:hypothetical protein
MLAHIAALLRDVPMLRRSDVTNKKSAGGFLHRRFYHPFTQTT